MSMTSTARTTVGGRLGVLIAGSLVFTALTAGTAAASVPTPMGIAAPEPTRLGTAVSPGTSLRGDSSSHPRTPVPTYLLERGRYTRFDAPGAVQQTRPPTESSTASAGNAGASPPSTPPAPPGPR